MRIKSYFADSVQEAIEKARVDLGPDAMLMNSKQTDFELRALGSFEVVFGVPGQIVETSPRLKNSDKAHRETSTLSLIPDEPTPGASKVNQELAELRRQIETVRRSLGRKQGADSPVSNQPSRTVENICARLIAADISEGVAQEIADAVELQAFAWKANSHQMRDYEMLPAETLELALAAELDRRLQLAPELGVPRQQRKLVMFVGPAGSGKTTCLIKLALRCGLQARLPLHILSLDTLRVGGWEHLAAYARIAGFTFDAVHSLRSLDQLLLEYASKKLILVDTPGFGAADGEDLKELGKWLERSTEVDVQLVLPANVRASIIDRNVERFSVLKPSKLLLTRADEVESPGIMVDFAMRSGLPLSYISTGQTIPEDIEQPTREVLLRCLQLKEPMQAAQHAA